MSKKKSILVLMLLACMVGFAQSNKSSGAGLQNEASTVIIERTKDFLTKMQTKLKGQKAKVEFGNLKKATKQQQFLFENGKIDTFLNPQSHGLPDVFTKLCAKENAPTEFCFDELNINKKNIHYKIFETGKKQGKVDSGKLIVPISFKTHTIAKNKVSDIEYSVILEWEVSIKKVTVKGDNGKRIGSYALENPVLIASSALPMQKEQKKEITEDNNDLRKTLPMPAEKKHTLVRDSVPITEGLNSSRFANPIAIVLEYAFRLSNYVANANEKIQKKVEQLFVNADVEIEVSNVQENGMEKIQKRSVSEYLSLLKGTTLKINLDGIIDHDNEAIPVFMVSQAYRSDAYSDDTRKQVYLMYNASTNTYLISKITVVPNSTKIYKQ